MAVNLHVEHPLPVAVALLAFAVVVDLCFLGGQALGHVLHWRAQR